MEKFFVMVDGCCAMQGFDSYIEADRWVEENVPNWEELYLEIVELLV